MTNFDFGCSLQRQVSIMSMNLSAKLDDLQRGDRQLETTVALCEIRTQLQELTKSVESCQSEVSEVSLLSTFFLLNAYLVFICVLEIPALKSASLSKSSVLEGRARQSEK